jgi:hypothetical protein
MHREKESSQELVDPHAFDEPPDPVDAGPLPHAAASRTRPAAAMVFATIRTAGSDARHDRRTTRVLSHSGVRRVGAILLGAGVRIPI